MIMTNDDVYELPSLDEAPWLIFNQKNDEPGYDNQIFCLINNNKSYSKTIVELHGKSILASNQTWLVLRERVNRSKYSIWNPVTRQCLNLPELLDPPYKEEPICMITSPPDGNTPCVVLLLKSHMFSCRPTIRPDDCWWVKQSLVLDGQIDLILTAATLNEDIYLNAFVDGGKSGVSSIFARIKVSDNDIASSSNMVLLEPLEIQTPSRSCKLHHYLYFSEYLFEVCGVLYTVHKMSGQGRVDYEIRMYVWRLDLSQMKWIEVKSLGDRAFLLGHSCCTWCWADASCSGIEGNCIYVCRSSPAMRQYCLQDDSYIHFKRPYLDIIQNFDKPIWFMPRKPTRLSPVRLITRKSEDTKNIKHFEELDEMKIDRLTSSLICQLPSDMLISVTKYLHLFDYMNLRATCKILRFNIPRSHWRSNCSYPLFMSLKHKKGGICELLDPCQNTCHTVVKPHSPNMFSSIEFCKDGWLLLRIEGHSLQCFNPFKRESYKYPSHDNNFGLISLAFSTCPNSLAFSTCPTSPDCLTVGIDACKYSVSVIYHRAGSGQWEYDNIELDTETWMSGFYSDNSSRPKYHDGSFYFLGGNKDLGVLKMVDGKWSWKVHKEPRLEDIFLYSCHLAELDSQLISIFIKENGVRVQVFKFDTLRNNWVALDDLGDYMLFVSLASSFSVSTKDNNNMRNRIYLPKRVGNEMVFYSLNDGMYYTSSGQHPSKDFYGMRSQSFCCWI